MNLFTISLFNNKMDNVPKPGVRTWDQLCAKFATPLVRQEKDGLLFSPATFEPARRLNANVKELSLLVLDCDHNAPGIETLRRAIRFLLESLDEPQGETWHRAFAIYSTHSHRQITASNPNAEPRYRVVIPLATPVPAEHFPPLWAWAAGLNAGKDRPQWPAVLTIDPQAKDPARIYYTPVKFDGDAPYEYWVEAGAPLDWKLCIDLAGNHSTTPASPALATYSPARGDSGACADRATSPRAPSASASSDKFSNHDDRHAELCNRIMVRGKRNGRGHYDARCIAHNGKGETGLLLNPSNGAGAVKCNAEPPCSYQDILRAEGLSWHNLPNKEQLAASSTSQRSQPSAKVTMIDPPPVVTAARLHAIYSLLLAHCFELSDADAERVQKHWGPPYGELVQWPGTDDQALIKVCSYPTMLQQWDAAARLAQDFDLTGVPGFFYLRGELPGQQGAQQRGVNEQYSPWRINLPVMRKPAALLSPYNNEGGFIVGVRIHRNVNDAKSIWLLSSKGLPGGARALAYRQEAA